MQRQCGLPDKMNIIFWIIILAENIQSNIERLNDADRQNAINRNLFLRSSNDIVSIAENRIQTSEHVVIKEISSLKSFFIK